MRPKVSCGVLAALPREQAARDLEPMARRHAVQAIEPVRRKRPRLYAIGDLGSADPQRCTNLFAAKRGDHTVDGFKVFLRHGTVNGSVDLNLSRVQQQLFSVRLNFVRLLSGKTGSKK